MGVEGEPLGWMEQLPGKIELGLSPNGLCTVINDLPVPVVLVVMVELGFHHQWQNQGNF